MVGNINPCINFNVPRRFQNVLYLYTHIENEEFPKYRDHQDYDVTLNRDLRIRFLLNDITEKGFEYLVKKREKEREYRQEMFELFQSVRLILEGVLVELNKHLECEKEMDRLIEEVLKIVRHFNCKSYDCLVYKYKYKSQPFINFFRFDVLELSKTQLASHVGFLQELKRNEIRTFYTTRRLCYLEEDDEEGFKALCSCFKLIS
jgi:hypothetical protein